MPAFYFGDPDIGGANATFEKNPLFDLRTPSQMGLATEIFGRTKADVALGPVQADYGRECPSWMRDCPSWPELTNGTFL